ncbi:MAG: PQQ-binding-like beta-propeller repeat protein [Terriglobales bacterium]
MRFAARFCAVMLLTLLFAGLATAAVTVTLSSKTGPPTTNLQVGGTGFPLSTTVDVYFDTSDMALAVTDATGAFSGIGIVVPASAVPGAHWVTAVARGTSGTAAQAAFTVQANWAEFHYSALGRGRNPYENVLTPTTVGNMDLDWTYTTAGALTSSPAVVKGVVYVGSADDNIYAINGSSGALVWKYATGKSIVDSSPAVVGGTVYIGSSDDNVYAINASKGTLVWKYKTGGAVNSSPAVANGVVYVGSSDDNLYAISTSTGALDWKYKTGGAVNSSPAVANGVVYVGSDDGGVYALDASTGIEYWDFTTGGKVFSSPAVANGVVYVGSDDSNFYALNISNGTVVWQFAGTGAFESSPAVANGVVYVGSDAGAFYGLNARNGGQIWVVTSATAVVVSPPAFAAGMVYFGLGSRVYAVENVVTPQFLWTGTTGAAVVSSPAVANGVLYISSEDGRLHAYDLTAGNMAKHFKPPARPKPAMLRPNLELQPSNSPLS